MNKMWTGGQTVKPWECTWLVIAKQMTFGLQANVKVLEPNNDDGCAKCDTVLLPVQAPGTFTALMPQDLIICTSSACLNPFQ
jgi:hypothetical protein